MLALRGTIYVHPFILHFIECNTNLAACGIENELVITNKLLQETTGKEKVLIYPETGTVFATIHFVNKGGKTCGLPKTLEVKSQKGKEKEGPLCNAPEIELTKKEHTIECTGAAGTNNLVLGEEEATFKGNFFTLLMKGETAEEWAIVEGK